MTFQLRTLLSAACLATALTGSAFATPVTTPTFSGTAYTDNGGTVVDPSTLSYKTGSASTSTFTVSSFNFQSPSSAYTVGGFLSGGANAVVNSTLGALSLANSELVFTGSVNLVNGMTYTFSHDDGMVLSVDGSSATGYGINAPSPTVEVPNSFTYAGTTGVHSFVLEYGENGEAPADLIGPFTPAGVTPEPSSIMLLGSGLVGLAGAVRRRIKA